MIVIMVVSFWLGSHFQPIGSVDAPTPMSRLSFGGMAPLP